MIRNKISPSAILPRGSPYGALPSAVLLPLKGSQIAPLNTAEAQRSSAVSQAVPYGNPNPHRKAFYTFLCFKLPPHPTLSPWGRRIKGERLKGNSHIDKLGFTYVEIALAVAMLSLILLGMMQMFATGAANSKKSQDQTTALGLAREKLEEKLLSSTTPSSESRATLSSPFQRFDRATTVSTYLASTSLYKVTVGVYWSEDGTEKNLELATLLAVY